MFFENFEFRTNFLKKKKWSKIFNIAKRILKKIKNKSLSNILKQKKLSSLF